MIDLGSYTAKLTIADITGDIFVLEKDECSIGLGKGFKDGKLESKAINGAVDVIRKWRNRLSNFDLAVAGAFATGVSRKAKNGDQLVYSVLKETGLSLRILSKEDEARFLFKGVVSDFRNEFTFMILSVGGGTTSLSIGEKSQIPRIFYVNKGTIELGKILQSDPPTDDQIFSLKNHIEELFKKTTFRVPLNKSVFIHTGGELDYVRFAGCRTERSKLSPTHPVKVMLRDFDAFAQRIRCMKKEELRSLKPDNPMWMDGAIVSNSIALCIANKFAFTEIIPSNRNVTDGFLLDLQHSHMLSLSPKKGD